MKDKSKIPKGVYCYVRGGCPYRETIPHMYVKFSGYKTNVIQCNYLNVNTMQLQLDGNFWGSWLLEDSCKPCHENMSFEEDDY